MTKFMCVAFLLTGCLIIIGTNAYSTPRGSQVRLTHRGLNYGLSLGVNRLQRDLKNKRLPNQSGRMGDIAYWASNVVVNHLYVGRSSVRPTGGNNVIVSMSSMSLKARGTIRGEFQKGWFRVGDQTNVQISAGHIAFTLKFNVGASGGKPRVRVTSCSSHIGYINLAFHGGLSWVYNAISGLFKGQLINIFKNVMCQEAMKLINSEANRFLNGFPVQQKIENYAYINYAFKRPVTTSSYIDFLLRGEFLPPNKPVPSNKKPPSFGTSTDSNRMAYVWITDFCLNSAGDVFHKTGLLKKFISPITNQIPANLKGFLNTASFAKLVPELYQQYPNRSLEFQLATNKAPTFKISAGKIHVFSDVRAKVVVEKIDGSKTAVFYLDLRVDASGSAFLKTVRNQLNVGGSVSGFTFESETGGSVLGDIKIPLDDPSIKQLVRGLVVDSANLILKHGFPVPRVHGLSFIKPKVLFVQNAIRIDTDIRYTG